MRRLHRDERGSAMVEFALVAPLLLVLLLGIYEFGRAWHTYSTITDAAREGARRAVINQGTEADKVGGSSADSLGAVPRVILQRLALAGLPTDSAWSPSNYTNSCDGWSAPAGNANATSVKIYGCGWGVDFGMDARVVVQAPYPFTFVRPVLQLVGGSVVPVVLQTNYVMRNE